MLTNIIISAVKRTFSRSKYVLNFKEKCIIKGKKGVRGGKVGRCNVCKKPKPFYLLQVDHINPVVPIMIPGKVMSFSMLYDRTFCEYGNLQSVCKECHKIKSKKELAQRVKWRKKKKYLVCRHSQGSRMKVIPIIDIKGLPEFWEVLAVYKERKDADKELKRRKKL